MFFIKKIERAFTLIELLVTITLIWILTLSISGMSFSKATIKQNSKIFANKILTSIESIRNNSLIWRSVKGWIPMYKANINFTLAWSWQMNISYNTWSTSPFISSTLSIIPEDTYSINKLECLLIDSTLDATTNSWTISIIWNEFNLIWCWEYTRILRITTKHKAEEETISINIVNWLVTSK